jgi:DNA-binding MarR family transcriptional regulator
MIRDKTAVRPAARARKAAAGLFDDFMPHLVARLAHQLNSDLVEKLRTEGINVTRWRILAVLAMGEGITINEIIDRAMMQQSALSRALSRMVREGYIRRVVRRDDARCACIYLTDKGRALFDTLNLVVRRREKQLLAGMSPREVRAAFTVIRRLSRNMQREADVPFREAQPSIEPRPRPRRPESRRFSWRNPG